MPSMAVSHLSFENFETASRHFAAAVNNTVSSVRIDLKACKRSAGDFGSNNHPAPVAPTSSESAPLREARTGTPCAQDSIRTRPNASSQIEGTTVNAALSHGRGLLPQILTYFLEATVVFTFVADCALL